MMPHKSIAFEIAQQPIMHLDVTKTFELNVENNKDLVNSNSPEHSKLNFASEVQEKVRITEVCGTYPKELSPFNNQNLSPESYKEQHYIMDPKIIKISDETLKSHVSIQQFHYVKRTILELQGYSLEDLKQVLEKLTNSIETVSGELVQLLLENDSLQQESDARNVAIEQLLKLTVKNTETEIKPIQMSVILPSNCNDNSDDES